MNSTNSIVETKSDNTNELLLNLLVRLCLSNYLDTPTAITNASKQSLKSNVTPAAYYAQSVSPQSVVGPPLTFGYVAPSTTPSTSPVHYYNPIPTQPTCPIQYMSIAQHLMAYPIVTLAQPVGPTPPFGYQIMHPAQQAPSESTSATLGSMGPTTNPGRETTQPHAFTAGILHDPASGA
ncbi:hypothetical protein Tco_0570564 [Tanacetum coccineum]